MSSKAHFPDTSIGIGGLTLAQAQEHFCLMARVDGRSHKTLAFYSYVFKDFNRFIRDPTINLIEIKPATIRAYLSHLMDRQFKKTSVGICLRVLKAFFNWLHREGLVTGFRPRKPPA